jgi:hypothetical protein
MSEKDYIKELETQYPEMTSEYKKIVDEQYQIFCKKMHDYGISNIMLGGHPDHQEDRNFALLGITIRLGDKINRLKNLLFKKKNPANESIDDSFRDTINYSIIATIIQNEKWGK